MIFYTLDYIVEQTLKQKLTAEQTFLKNFTGAKISAADAAYLYERITDHKWYVSEKLGRDVGVNVAAVDYLENIYEGKSDSTDSHRNRRGFNMRVYENLSLTA